MGTAAMKLGKKHAIHDSRTIDAAKYINTSAAPPLKCDWLKAVRKYPMLGNDRIGDCTIASNGHRVICQTANADGAKNAVKPTEKQIIKAYSDISGYDPKTGANDDGCVMLDVLKYLRSKGIAGQRIGAYAAVKLGDPHLLMQSIYLFGGVWMGVELPDAALETFDWRAPTSPSQRIGQWAPNPSNGHAIYVASYDSQAGTFDIVSWGRIVTANWAFVQGYADECYVVASESWTNDVGLAPSGIDLRGLIAEGNRLAA